ncbi:motility associated factor glycosyltransferase family protein [Aliarcobacter butzleri]|uniref:motility associated factor glycosyltransferase family protein n=1 Tax=Aliarcobacter butzleri TaxID=28197 RepID=UPI002B2487AB|nr:6-hydroxymethylpterin diphosphokinase MptE-like protein [Aliarcobacter butzleri]
MTEAQIQLQNALTTTFLANLVFLSEYDRDLYHRVDELSRMIENGIYQEKYALEFLMENGEFDIYDIVNDKYLYNKNPKKFNDELINKVNFDEKESIFEIQPYFTIKNRVNIDYERRFELEKLNDLNNLTLKDTQEYTDFTKEYLEKREEKKFKRIDKFIFLGTLLGRHIPKIAEKIDASSYLVLERNLEIFRLSLFTVDYTILAKKGAIFSIMDNVQDEERKIYKYLDFHRIDNYLLKLSTTNINIDRYIDTILNMIQTMNPTSYDYNRRMYVHINRTTKYFQENYKFLDFKKIKENSKLFENIPILYVAAGPSLDENVDWIKQNQNKFFIVCIGRALKKLLKNNIRVDIVTTLDEQEFLVETQFDDETISLLDKNTLIFASSITNKNLLNKFNKEHLFLYEVFYPFYKGNISYGGFSVGEIALEILLKFNPKEIFLMGLDLAVDQKTGATHSSEDRVKVVKLNLTRQQDRSKFEMRGSLVKVKGNFKKEVYTTPLFYGSIKMIEDKLRRKNKSTKIYNLSNNGAKFEGTISKKINKIILKSHEEQRNLEIHSFLNKNSFSELNKESRKNIKSEIDYIEVELEKTLTNIDSKGNILYVELLKDIEGIVLSLAKNHFINLNQIIYLYCELYLPYLSYYFNDKKIKTERKKVKEIRKIFIKQLQQIVNDYKLCLERIV